MDRAAQDTTGLRQVVYVEYDPLKCQRMSKKVSKKRITTFKRKNKQIVRQTFKARTVEGKENVCYSPSE